MEDTPELTAPEHVDQLACHGCEKQGDDVKRRRQKTQYVDEESNFSTLCDECQKEADEYWSERWAEYYVGCL